MKKNSGMKKNSTKTGSPAKEKAAGILYVVATPIGNLEDITLRAIRVLKEVEIVAAENVSHTKGLCHHYGIKTRLTSYNQHNRTRKGPELIKLLTAGKSIALVTDAGTPGISDPGVYLIHLAGEARLTVTPIPGPSAMSAALSVSGMSTEQFVFLGFLPNKAGKRKKALESLMEETRTMVFYEAPHRLKATMADVNEILGNRRMVMLREMTKVFEEIRRGSVSDILARVKQNTIRGEFTLVVEGREPQQAGSLGEKTLLRIQALLSEERESIRDIATRVSREEGVQYRPVYKTCLAIKRRLER
jgi:16S rRNA (cytidine1402-2'-O)-methyltransferase